MTRHFPTLRLLPAALTVALSAGLAGVTPAQAATPTTAAPGAATVAPVPLSERHPGRRMVHYTVRRGDTPSSIATRFHAWTRELMQINGIRRASQLRAGERIVVPVVIARAGRTHHSRPHTTKPLRHGWRHANLSRQQVRTIITRRARNLGVPPKLALAIAWQESGWRQPLVSSAGAIGVMQLLPETGRWMSLYAKRRLWIRDTHDNVSGGLYLIKWLRQQTRSDRTAIAAYYQGLGAVREHGLYRDTKQYVRSVQAIRRSLG